jgi:hypothetical protein
MLWSQSLWIGQVSRQASQLRDPEGWLAMIASKYFA